VVLIHQRYRQTDRQTDDMQSQYRTLHYSASCGKNGHLYTATYRKTRIAVYKIQTEVAYRIAWSLKMSLKCQQPVNADLNRNGFKCRMKCSMFEILTCTWPVVGRHVLTSVV